MHRGRIIKGTALNFIAVGFNQGSTLIVNIFVARILMRHAFGEYTMVHSTLLTMSVLSQLALGYTASKYIAEYRSNDPNRAGQIMGLCAFISVIMASFGALVLVLIAPWLAETVLKASHLASPLKIGAGFLFFSAINGYQTGALAGLEAYRGLAKAGLASGIFTVVTVPCAAYFGGINGALIGLGITALVRGIFHNRQLSLETAEQGIKPQYHISVNKEKAIISKFAFPAAVAGYYSMPMIWLANSILIRQPDGYGEMALFGAANNIRILVLFLPNVMNSVGLSVLNNEKANNDVESFMRLFKTNVLNIFLVSLSGAFIMGIVGRSFLYLFGKDFEDGYFILLLLLIASIFEGLSIALYQYLQSHAKIWLSLFTINVPREGCLLVSTYFLAQSYAGAGLATAYMGSAILGFILHLYLVAVLCGKNRKKPGSYALRASVPVRKDHGNDLK
jgi:O-antigen/teichoic acid export membrane protein